jgi:hypothetical protein
MCSFKFNLRRYTLEGAVMGAMEMFALGLKATVAYMVRSLSYASAEFEVTDCPLSDEMTVMVGTTYPKLNRSELNRSELNRSELKIPPKYPKSRAQMLAKVPKISPKCRQSTQNVSPCPCVMYDRSCELWQMLYRVFRESEVGRQAGKGRGAMRWAQFWAGLRTVN